TGIKRREVYDYLFGIFPFAKDKRKSRFDVQKIIAPATHNRAIPLLFSLHGLDLASGEENVELAQWSLSRPLYVIGSQLEWTWRLCVLGYLDVQAGDADGFIALAIVTGDKAHCCTTWVDRLRSRRIR